MKKFEAPEILVQEFELEDVVNHGYGEPSTGDDDMGWG